MMVAVVGPFEGSMATATAERVGYNSNASARAGKNAARFCSRIGLHFDKEFAGLQLSSKGSKVKRGRSIIRFCSRIGSHLDQKFADIEVPLVGCGTHDVARTKKRGEITAQEVSGGLFDF